MQIDSSGFAATTTNATQTSMGTWGSGVANGAAGTMHLRVAARVQGGSDCRAWSVEISWRKDGSGNMAITGSLATLLDQGTVGAALWGLAVTASGGTLDVRATGAASTTISWAGNADMYYIDGV